MAIPMLHPVVIQSRNGGFFLSICFPKSILRNIMGMLLRYSLNISTVFISRPIIMASNCGGGCCCLERGTVVMMVGGSSSICTCGSSCWGIYMM